MSTSQRVNRGFHQLGIVLAAIPLVLGIALTALAPVMYWHDPTVSRDCRNPRRFARRLRHRPRDRLGHWRLRTKLVMGKVRAMPDEAKRIKLVYQDANYNLRFLKQQEWAVTRYALAAYGALFAVAKAIEAENDEQAFLILAVIFVAVSA